MQHLKSLAGFLIVVTISCALSVHGSVVSRIGDVDIFINETLWLCDKIVCPPDTEYCRITKQKMNPDDTYLIRSNICYSGYNTELRRGETYEPIGPNTMVSVNVTASHFGITSQAQGSSFYGDNSFVSAGYEMDRQKLLENINQVQIRVQQEMDAVNRHIQEQISNAFRGWV